MDDITRLKEQWIEASRRRHAPSSVAASRMARGLRARIEAGEPAPSVRPERDADIEPAAATVAGRPWIWGAGVLLAAAAVLLWDARSAPPQIHHASRPSAAGYEAEDDRAARAVRDGRERAPRERDETTSETTAPVVVEPPAPSVAAPRTRSRGTVAGSAPSSSTPVDDHGALAPEAAADAGATAALDVAGEVAVLRRVKAAIDRREWAQASSALREYEASYPDGVLTLDAHALGVLVECHQRTSTAEDRAADFLRRHPTSSLRDRIRDACELSRDP